MPPFNTGEQRPQDDDELMSVAAPSKRRKIDVCSAVAVKRERSPSPSLVPLQRTRSPQLSGVIFVKYPSDCSPPHANWKANRSRCLCEETAKLQALGLTIVRRLIRDDGLAFDWSSEVPVDCVTLKPPNFTRNASQSATVQPTTSDSSRPTRETSQSAGNNSQPTDNTSRQASSISQSTRNSRPPRDASQASDVPPQITRSQSTRDPSQPRRETDQVNDSDPTSTTSDLLGLALQDQVTICQTTEPSEPAAETAAPNVMRLMNIDRSMAEASSSESSEFAVVGAAIRDTSLSGDQQPASSPSSPKEYRRLIPPDVRIYKQNANSKFSYRFNEPASRRKRRLEWIEKEVQKIEGYTGEKVSGYKYDGNYVIITLESRNRNAANVSNYRPPSRPTPITPNGKAKQSLPKPKPRPVTVSPKAPVHVSPHATTTTARPPIPALERPQSSTHSQLNTRPTPPVRTQTNTPTERRPPQRSSLSSASSTKRVMTISSTANAPTTSATPAASATSAVSTQLPSNISNISAAGTSNSNPARALSPAISISSDDSNALPSPRSLFTPFEKQSIAQRQASPEHLDLKSVESRGLQFLERYLMLYDANRQELASAFTPNATFTLTDDVIHGAKPRQVVNSPSAISQAIQNLDDGLHRSIKSNISYDMTPLDDVNPGAMMLVCDGTVVPRNHSAPSNTFSRIFILRRNTDNDRNLWPLKIAVEKLTLKRI